MILKPGILIMVLSPGQLGRMFPRIGFARYAVPARTLLRWKSNLR